MSQTGIHHSPFPPPPNTFPLPQVGHPPQDSLESSLKSLTHWAEAFHTAAARTANVSRKLGGEIPIQGADVEYREGSDTLSNMQNLITKFREAESYLTQHLNRIEVVVGMAL